MTTIFDVIDEEAKKATSFVTIQAGQKMLLKFDTNKISVVETEFQGKKGKRVQYKVVEPNQPFDEKDFRLGFTHAKQLNALLKAGLNLIMVERQGAGLA